MKKRVFNHLFLILYPILPLILLPIYDYHLSLLLKRYPGDTIWIFLVVYILYFLIFAWFVYRFFVKKEPYRFFPAMIGLLESAFFLLCLFYTPLLSNLSRPFFNMFFNNVTLNSYAVFTVFSIYAVLLIAQKRQSN